MKSFPKKLDNSSYTCASPKAADTPAKPKKEIDRWCAPRTWFSHFKKNPTIAQNWQVHFTGINQSEFVRSFRSLARKLIDTFDESTSFTGSNEGAKKIAYISDEGNQFTWVFTRLPLSLFSTWAFFVFQCLGETKRIEGHLTLLDVLTNWMIHLPTCRFLSLVLFRSSMALDSSSQLASKFARVFFFFFFKCGDDQE